MRQLRECFKGDSTGLACCLMPYPKVASPLWDVSNVMRFFVFSDVLESESELLVLSVLLAHVLDRFLGTVVFRLDGMRSCVPQWIARWGCVPVKTATRCLAIGEDVLFEN